MNKTKTETPASHTQHKELSELSAKMDEVIRLLKKLNSESPRKTHFADIINKDKIRR